MQTFLVVETQDGWWVESDGQVIFEAPAEEPCFQHALDTSSRLFEDGLKTEVLLRRRN